jgi:hypothetical protein
VNARPMRHKQNRRTRVTIILSLFSLAIPAVASAQPGILSTPTVSIRAGATGVLGATPEWRLPRFGWLGEGTSIGTVAKRTRSVVVQRQVAAQPTTAPPTASVVTAPSGRADWHAIAACESGGRWDINSGNGFWGGLQFFPSTWFAYGGGPFDGVGPFPYSASQQIAVGERVLAGQGPSAWPNCFRWA